MFSGFFLLVAGVIMLVCTILGIRRGNIMTLGKSTEGNAAKWASRGQADFVPYAVVWFCTGVFLVYQGMRLMFFV